MLITIFLSSSRFIWRFRAFNLSFLQRHILGFAVGHHTNNANHQQRHTDARDRQHPSLVELLSLCEWKHMHIQTHTCSHARAHLWIADTPKTDRRKYTHIHTHTDTHIQHECFSNDGNYSFLTIICCHPIPCSVSTTPALSCHMSFRFNCTTVIQCYYNTGVILQT